MNFFPVKVVPHYAVTGSQILNQLGIIFNNQWFGIQLVTTVTGVVVTPTAVTLFHHAVKLIPIS